VQEQHVEAKGTQFRYLESGSGRPVVLIHGIPTSAELWRHVMPLVRGVRLLAWEMVGYGRSWGEGDQRDISVKAQAGYLIDWLDEMGIERALLVGHDLGGGVAQIAAVRSPKRVSGLVLSNAISYDSWPIARVKVMRALGALARRTPRPLFKRQLAMSIRPGHVDSDRARESFEAHWPGYSHDHGPATLIRQMRSMRTEDTLEVADRLAWLELPAAIVWGAKDPFQKLEYAERLALDLKTRLEVIPRGRHFVPEDSPEQVAAAIERVLPEADWGESAGERAT
jgi:pimeloyl-ACP methyl ester carboxylesterase